MFFGSLPPHDAIGTWLAHGIRIGERRHGKGTRITADLAARLSAAGIASVTVARLEAGDIPEDDAAGRIATALAGPGLRAAAPFTGRANLYAESAGLLALNSTAIHQLNAVDEAITLATLPDQECVTARQMVATVKIIPFAVSAAHLTASEAILTSAAPLLRLHPFRPLRTVLLQTELPGLKAGVLDGTAEVTRERIESLGALWQGERRCPHQIDALATELARAADADLILIAGASAVVDRRDVLPAAIVAAGGRVDRFGLPVDPGNLLLIGTLNDRPVIGLPGCARSPKLNGFDWILRRILAGLPVDDAVCAGLGVGGLLKEIGTRPQPRGGSGVQRAPKVAALVLAAGLSSRMGQPKLLLPLAGQPMIAHTVDALIASAVSDIIVVTGPDAEPLRAALAGRTVRFVQNPMPEGGLSTSLRTGLRTLPADCDAFLVALGDMPLVGPALIDRLIAAYNPTEGRAICAPRTGDRRGNPILWDREFQAELMAVSGDMGGRVLLQRHNDQVCDVAVEGDAILTDIDTPEDYRAVLTRPPPAP